jgi:hypothetical protein
MVDHRVVAFSVVVVANAVITFYPTTFRICCTTGSTFKAITDPIFPNAHVTHGRYGSTAVSRVSSLFCRSNTSKKELYANSMGGNGR